MPQNLTQGGAITATFTGTDATKVRARVQSGAVTATFTGTNATKVRARTQGGAITATFTGEAFRRLPGGSWITPLPPSYGGKTMGSSHDFMIASVAAAANDSQNYSGQGLRPLKKG